MVQNRNTTTKLLIAFGGMAFMTAIVGYQGIHGMGVIDELLTVNYEKHAPGSIDIQEAHVQVRRCRGACGPRSSTRPSTTRRVLEATP